MSRRMIDEGALNAQIQEATTTKQDKLKAGAGIEIDDRYSPNKISSYVRWSTGTINKPFTIPAKTYKAGDIIDIGKVKISGLYIGTTLGTYPILSVGDTGMKVYQRFTIYNLDNNTVYLSLIVVNDATISQPTEFIFTQGYAYLVDVKKV